MMNHPNDKIFLNTDPEDDNSSNKPGLWATLLILLMIASILSTLFWPLIWQTLFYYSAPPTPTPLFLQEASIAVNSEQ